jgi:hypothetical protein
MPWNATGTKVGAAAPSAFVATRARNRNDGLPRGAEYKEIFPIGAYIQMISSAVTMRDMNTGGTVVVSVDNPTGLTTMINHPEQGILAAGMDAIIMGGGVPYPHDVSQGIVNQVAALTPDGRIKLMLQPVGRTDTAGVKGWDKPEWYGTLPFDPLFHTVTQAQIPAAEVNAIYGTKPAVVAYNLKDDVAYIPTENHARDTAVAIQATNLIDGYGRATTATFTDPSAIALVPTADLRLVNTYRYPCGQYSNGTPTLEGDFHRSTFGGLDWIAYLRANNFLNIPSDVPIWLDLQAHKTITGGSGQLRYPYPSEFGMQGWLAIGEGVKGIFWFHWGDQAPNWEGLGNPNSYARFAAVRDFTARITQGIRSRLLRTVKDTDRFTVSGGGSAGYPVNYSNAYVSTLIDAQSSVYYVVIVNHSASTASITVSGTSGFTTGTLTNLETGVVTNVGSAVSLAGFDGSIWKWAP